MSSRSSRDVGADVHVCSFPALQTKPPNEAAADAPASPPSGAASLADGGGAWEVEPLRIARRGASAKFEREYVKMVLERSGGNITRAAELAQVSRQMIQKMMRKYAL